MSKIKGAQSRFDELVLGGMNEYVAARKILVEKNKEIHGEMNALKKELGIPQSDFDISPDVDISEIEKGFNENMANLISETEVSKKAIVEKEEKQKAEIEQKQKDKQEQQKAKKTYPLVGKKITIAGKEWVVENKKGQYYINNGEVRVKTDEAGIKRLTEEKPKPTKSANPAKPKPLGVKQKPKLAKPKPALGTKKGPVERLQQSIGLSKEAAKEVFDLAKQVKNNEITQKEFEKQYAQIVARDRGLKVSENGVMLSAIPDVTEFESAEDIVAATKEFEQNRKDYVERSAQESVSDTMDAMRADGRVQVDKGVVDLLAGKGDNLIDQNTSLLDLLTGGDRALSGAAAAFIAIRRLIMNKNSNELARLFSKVGVKLKVINDGGYQVLNEKGSAIGRNLTKQQAEELAASQVGPTKIKGPIIMAAVEMQNGKPMPTIVINAASLGDRVAQLGGEKHFFNWLETALWEEVIHLASYKVSNEAELTAVGKSLTDEQRSMVEYIYGRKLTDFEAGSEYVRMMVQESVLGTTTEMFRIQSMQQKIKDVVSKIIKYLKSVLGTTPKSRIAAKVVKNLEDYIKDNRENAPKEAITKRRPAEKQNPEKPRITWSVVPGTRVMRIMYNNRQFFIKEQNGAFYEVYQPSMGRWEPVQDGQVEAGFLGYNLTQAKQALDKRAEDSGLEEGVISEAGPWADDASNELFNQMFGGRSAAQKALDIVNGDQQDDSVYDPLDDFSWTFSSELMILQDYFLTAVKRAEGAEQNPAEYERATLLAARAEWDMRELISEVFAENGYDNALNYFLFQITNENIPAITRQLALRLLIERFEGVPDLANYLKTKLDKVFASYSGAMLYTRRNFNTLETGKPEVEPTGGSSAPSDKGLWGRDLSQADSDKITNAVQGGEEILADKVAIEDELGNNFVSEEVYEQMSAMVDEAESRYEEAVQALKEVRSSLVDVKKSAEKIDKELAGAKASEAKARIAKRYNKEKNPIRALIEKINKIAEQC